MAESVPSEWVAGDAARAGFDQKGEAFRGGALALSLEVLPVVNVYRRCHWGRNNEKLCQLIEAYCRMALVFTATVLQPSWYGLVRSG